MTGRHRGMRLGACTDCRSFWGQYRAGKVDAEDGKAGFLGCSEQNWHALLWHVIDPAAGNVAEECGVTLSAHSRILRKLR